MNQADQQNSVGQSGKTGNKRVATRDLATIGQRWQLRSRSRNGIVVRIRQVHRKDQEVEAVVLDPQKLSARGAWLRIAFADLRRKYKLIDNEAQHD